MRSPHDMCLTRLTLGARRLTRLTLGVQRLQQKKMKWESQAASVLAGVTAAMAAVTHGPQKLKSEEESENIQYTKIPFRRSCVLIELKVSA
jgi:hypothetical protein